MTDKQKNFITRTLTAIVFVVVLVGCIFWGPLSFTILFGVITVMTAWEFCTIVNKKLGLQVNRFITSVSCGYLFYAVNGFTINPIGYEIFIPYLATIVYLMVSELYFDRENSIQNWALTMMCHMYVALPMASMNLIAFHAVNTEFGANIVYDPIIILSVFFFLWCSDAGAYCVGSLIGKHKLFPRISPAKSWEGSIGGGVLAILVSQIISYFAPTDSIGNVGGLWWAGLAAIVVVFGTWGDLVESLLKRKLGIKDSGNILPGHGGMLDRFDSTILAFPAAVVYIYVVNMFF